MPKRTREHRLAEEAVRAFADAIEPRLKLYERPQPEYGIDGDVEEFDEDDRATGLQFFVQVKGTDEEVLSRALAVSIPTETADYYRASSMPVLMVRLHAQTRALYVRWFHQYDPYYSRGGEKSLTFRWDPSDAWTDSGAERLVADARAFYELRSASLALPRPVHVVGDSQSISEAELRIALRAEASATSDLISVAGGPPPPGAAFVRTSPDELEARLATVTGATLHLRDPIYSEEGAARPMAVDALVLLALAFERLGQDTIAARLAAAYLPRSGLVGNFEVVSALAGSMARAHRVSDALALADQLDDPDDQDLADAGFVFGLAAMTAGGLSPDEVRALERVLRNRVKRRKKSHPVDAGQAAMNLATFHRSRKHLDKAASHYETALKLDPDYDKRAHYWFERAGAFWGTRQFERGAEAYGRAIELGSSESLALALKADCLLYAGRYREALHGFEQFHAIHPDADDGEYRIKARALRHLIEVTGLEHQRRSTDQALRRSEREEPRSPAAWIALSMRQLQADALWGSAWLNIGVARSERSEDQAALEAHIVSTVLTAADYEAWCNAVFAALQCADWPALDDLIVAGRRLGGEELIDELLRWAQRLPGEMPKAFAKAVDHTLAERGPPQPKLRLRMLSEDGAVEEIVFGEDPATPSPD